MRSRASDLNRLRYCLGTKVKEAQPAGPAHITVKESGPLVATLQDRIGRPGLREAQPRDSRDRRPGPR